MTIAAKLWFAGQLTFLFVAGSSLNIESTDSYVSQNFARSLLIESVHDFDFLDGYKLCIQLCFRNTAERPIQQRMRVPYLCVTFCIAECMSAQSDDLKGTVLLGICIHYPEENFDPGALVTYQGAPLFQVESNILCYGYEGTEGACPTNRGLKTMQDAGPWGLYSYPEEHVGIQHVADRAV